MTKRPYWAQQAPLTKLSKKATTGAKQARTIIMPVLTVLLIRHAESIVDSGEAQRLHETLDPPLTDAGYRTAHEFWLDLLEHQLNNSHGDDDDDDNASSPQQRRQLACFSAPFMACHSTALLLSAADMPKYPHLTWRLTVAKTASVPAAVPIVVHNQLASFAPNANDYSTLDKILAAGLLHGASAGWNHAESRKCPLSAKLDQVQSVIGGGADDKNTGDDFLHRWKQDRTVHPPRKVLEAQFLYQTDPQHWWSLSPLTGKRNLLVDLLAPNKYMPPPRHGIVQSMLDHHADETAHDPVQAVRECVHAARAAGCDTVLLVLPAPTIAAAIRELIGGGGGGSNTTTTISTSPLSMTACAVNVHDDDDPTAMSWTIIQHDDTTRTPLPPPEPVDCTDVPPADIDPASVPPNQWSVFPVPEPENIPDDYPDLPPFGMALSKTPPGGSIKSAPPSPLRDRPTNNVTRGPPAGRGAGARQAPTASSGPGRGGTARAPTTNSSAGRQGGGQRAGGRTSVATGRVATGQRGSTPTSRGGGGRGPAPVAAEAGGARAPTASAASTQQQQRQQQQQPQSNQHGAKGKVGGGATTAKVSPMSPTPRSPGRVAGSTSPTVTRSPPRGRSPARLPGHTMVSPGGTKNMPSPARSPASPSPAGGRRVKAAAAAAPLSLSPRSPTVSQRQQQQEDFSTSSSSLSSPPLSPQSPRSPAASRVATKPSASVQTGPSSAAKKKKIIHNV